MQRDSWYHWFADKPWAIELAVVIAFLLILNVGLKKVLFQLQRKAKLKENDWRFHLDYAALTPARVLLWILLFSVLFDLAIARFQLGGIFLYITAIRNAGIVFCLAWFLLRWKKVIHRAVWAHPNKKTSGQFTIDPFTLEVVGKIFTIIVIFVSVLISMQLFGLDVMPLITFGGIGAATLGFAAKDAIANFFGGLMIYLTRPFMIHDQIELPGRKVIGFVEEIGWYLTSIRDLQKRPVYIPNSVFSTETLINLSRITHRRIDEIIGIRYSDINKVPKIIEGIHALLERHTSVDHHQVIHVFLQSLAPSSVQIEIKVYILHTRYDDFMEVRQDILTQICRIIEDAGAEIPFPTTTVLMQTEEKK
jgi:MscS family membrane protein